MPQSLQFSCSIRRLGLGFTALALSALFAASAVPAQQAGDLASVDTLRLNLRSGPGTENAVIREMPEGTRLRVKARHDGWAEVVLEEEGGVSGWTSARFLKGCCHINSTSLQVGVPISHQATLAAIFHASNASSRW